MCTSGDSFLFCSCEDKNRRLKNTRALPNYTWTLTKYLGQNNSGLMGKIVIPKKDLENGITVDAILEQLNTITTSFDFEYIPSERDCLDISIPHPAERLRYFRVIYLEGIWKEGGNNIFNSDIEVIAKGKIRKHHVTSDTQE